MSNIVFNDTKQCDIKSISCIYLRILSARSLFDVRCVQHTSVYGWDGRQRQPLAQNGFSNVMLIFIEYRCTR